MSPIIRYACIEFEVCAADLSSDLHACLSVRAWRRRVGTLLIETFDVQMDVLACLQLD